MGRENISQEFTQKRQKKKLFRWRNRAKKLKNKKFKKFCTILNYNEHFLILASTITGCVSICAFASLGGVPIAITSYEIRFKICAVTAAIIFFSSNVKRSAIINN